MAVELLMPRLGWTMEEGVFVRWLKQDGDQVQPGDLLFTIEGDKASDDIETFESGILRISPDAPAPGTILPVGARLGYIVQPGEPPPFETTDDRPPTTDHRPPATMNDRPRTTDNGPRTTRQGPAISPRARRVAAELGVEWAAVAGSGRSGRIVERDIRALARRPLAAEVRA